VLCDLVPKHVGHILLGRPWQYDRRVIHDGFMNRYNFVKDGKTFKLAPLTPKQVHEDQLKLKSEIEPKKKRVKKKIERCLRIKKREWSHERKKKENLQREKERQR
jgi:hypothetical protein